MSLSKLKCLESAEVAERRECWGLGGREVLTVDSQGTFRSHVVPATVAAQVTTVSGADVSTPHL